MLHVLVALFIATAVAAPSRTTADFIRACSKGAEDADCQREYNHGTSAYGDRMNATICLPAPAGGAPDLLVEAVKSEVANLVAWLKAHPELATQDSAISVRTAAEALHPCK